MKRRIDSGFKMFFLVLLLLLTANVLKADNGFTFDSFPDLPPLEPNSVQEGLAGHYAGISNDALIIAGGANFPDKRPWDGGLKVYYDDIYVLLMNENGQNHKWFPQTFKLPGKMAYGSAVTLDEGVLCIGGNDEKTCFSNVFLLRWDNVAKSISTDIYPSLPTPLTSCATTILGDKVYVFGGSNTIAGDDQVNHFYVLDLGEKDSQDFAWQTLPVWPGQSRIYPVAVAQSNGVHNCLYLFSGRNVSSEGKITVLYDGFEYNPVFNTWKQLDQNVKFPVMAGTAFPVGANNIVFPGGADGKMMYKEISIKKEIQSAKQSKGLNKARQIDLLNQKLLLHLTQHPGFNRDILVYNTVTSALSVHGHLPFPTHVTTTAIPYKNDVIIPSGEIRPGIRTPAIHSISVTEHEKYFGLTNSFVLLIYIVVLAWMGWHFSKKQKNTNDFFKGGGRIPWWAAGLSIFGTALSAITFMAIPAKTYATDWSYFMFNMGIVLVAPLIIWWFIPFYRKLNVTTAYEFLEIRFNLATRLIGSFSFILFQIGRMGVVLFLPSIALSVVTGIHIIVCILIMGLLSMIYTSIGGIEAVIWTDVLQVIVLLGGALLSLVYIALHIDGGLFGIINIGMEQEKFNILNMAFDFKQPFLWTVLVGSIFTNLTTYGTDQTMVQRYLTVKDQRAAANSVWTNALLSVPASIMFFLIGTALFVFYRQFPAQMSLSIKEADAVFPWYIMTQLPKGISGLLISGVFAAAMSSLSSSINSAATAYINDFHQRFGWGDRTNALQAARWASVIVGIVGILFAIFMATWDIKSLWDEFNKILGLVLGGLGGVFLLGVLSRRANGIGALCGIAVSAVVQYFIAQHQPVHLLMYTATGVISCFASGWFISLFFSQKKDINKLYTMKK